MSNEAIDKFGIRKAVIFGVEKVLEKFSRKPDLVLMDGSLFAPKEYKQETIIKGDEKVPLISAGSIIAQGFKRHGYGEYAQKISRVLF